MQQYLNTVLEPFTTFIVLIYIKGNKKIDSAYDFNQFDNKAANKAYILSV